MGTVLHGAHSPKLERRIDLDSWLFEGEMDRIAREREGESLKLNGNGNHSHEQRFCDCPETVVRGKRVPCPPQHDCFYCRTRSGLVDQAARNANRRVAVSHGAKIGDAANQWTKVFASEMDRLSEQLCL